MLVSRDRPPPLPDVISPRLACPEPNFSQMQHDQAAAQIHDQSHVVLDQKHCQVMGLTNALDQLPELRHFAMGQAARRLVEQQQARACSECARSPRA